MLPYARANVSCEPLKVFFENTGGIYWMNKTGRLQATSCSNWHGVTCQSGEITEIKLTCNGLAGGSLLASPPRVCSDAHRCLCLPAHSESTGGYACSVCLSGPTHAAQCLQARAPHHVSHAHLANPCSRTYPPCAARNPSAESLG